MSLHPEPTRTEVIAGFIAKYSLDFGLLDWTLFAGEVWPEDNKTEDAFVWRHPAERHAIIFVNPNQPDSQVERLVVHELLHIAHVRLDDLGNNGQPVGVIEAYDRELEMFVNVISSVITGIAWEPTGEWADRFEAKRAVD